MQQALSAWVAWHCSVPTSAGAAVASQPAAAQGHAPGRRVMVLGDSLSAEYGLVRGTGWVPLLQQRLLVQRPGWQVVNASISGDTTSGGLSRLPGLLAQHRPQVLVLELGGNDALRGLPLANTRDNLLAMIHAAQAAQARVLLLGMQVPPNYGAQYTEAFRALYPALAHSERVALVPFFLQGIGNAADPTAHFQADRIHPNAPAQATMLDNVWPHLLPLLR